jgi:hypothetical protein
MTIVAILFAVGAYGELYVALGERSTWGTLFVALVLACLSYAAGSHGGRGSRSRQRNGERISSQYHEGNQPPDCPLAVGKRDRPGQFACC